MLENTNMLKHTFTQPPSPAAPGLPYRARPFSTGEIARIQESFKPVPEQAATTVGAVDDYRRSKIKWAPTTEDFTWLYTSIESRIQDANQNAYRFDLASFSDPLQWTRYTAHDNGKFDWHLDWGNKELSLRKLTCIVILSDPNSYVGGELQLTTSKSPYTLPPDIGSVYVFPSFFMHRVLPITQGIRETLVAWAGGTPFR